MQVNYVLFKKKVNYVVLKVNQKDMLHLHFFSTLFTGIFFFCQLFSGIYYQILFFFLVKKRQVDLWWWGEWIDSLHVAGEK